MSEKVHYREDYQPPTFRKVAYGTWRTAADPSVYGFLDIDMSHALRFVKNYEEQHPVKITATHLVAQAITHCLKIRPEINGLLRRGKIYLRQEVSLFFQVSVPGTGDNSEKIKKANLSGTTIHHADNLSLAEIAQALSSNAKAIRSGKDPKFNQAFNIMRSMPWFLMRYFLNLVSWLTYDVSLDLTWAGLPRDPFGSVMITNVGSLGIDCAFAPLCPYTRVPILLTIGAINDRPVAIDGRVEVRPMMSIGVTFDHRFMDGIHAAQMSKEFKNCFAQPEKYFH
ncbi:MAG: 2-oxo acid dehydrogenase subunit E2 [Pseudomonadota bacterium]